MPEFILYSGSMSFDSVRVEGIRALRLPRSVRSDVQVQKNGIRPMSPCSVPHRDDGSCEEAISSHFEPARV